MEKGKGKEKGKGMGAGPIGKPQEEMFAADSPEFEKVEKKVDMIVDSAMAECGNETKNMPSNDAEEELNRVHDDIAGYGDPEDVEKEYAGGMETDDSDGMSDGDNEGGLGGQLESIFHLNEKGEYHMFFKRMMTQDGISSIGKLSHDEKSAFFKKISAAWKKEKGKSVAESFNKTI